MDNSFFSSGLIAIISSLFASLRDTKLDNWHSSLSWIGLQIGSLSLFYVEVSILFKFQRKEAKNRNIFLAGSVPLIISGLVKFG